MLTYFTSTGFSLQFCNVNQNICRSIPLLQRRTKIITQRLQQLGATIHTAPVTAATSPLDLASSISHIVLHPSDLDGSSSGGGSRSSGSAGKQGTAASVQQVLGLMQQLRQLQEQRRSSHQQQQQQWYVVRLVSDEWLDAVLSAGRYIPEQQYSLERLLASPGGSSSDDDSDDEDGQLGSSRKAAKRQRGQQQQQQLWAAGPRHMPDLDPSPDAPMGK
jgi:hypothetical protein